MRNPQNKIAFIGSVFMILALLWVLSIPLGCTPPADTPQKPTVVRKKIVAKEKPTKKALQPQPPGVKKPWEAKGSGQEPTPAHVKDKDTKQVEPEKKNPSLTAAKSDSDTRIADEDLFGELYNPEGKIDPFLSPLKTKAEREEEKKKKAKRRIPRTPLEKIDISQMKLTAIIQSHRGYIGMVEESSGKGYVVSTGTFIGLNGGRIKKILKDRLVIEEETEDAFGKMRVREIEVRLFKPAGEL